MRLPGLHRFKALTVWHFFPGVKIALNLVIIGSLHSLLQAVNDHCAFVLQIGGELGGSFELSSWQALRRRQGTFQDLEPEMLIPFSVGSIHSADET